MIRRRRFKGKLPIQGHFYPMPSSAFIEDETQRITLLGRQANGVASLEPEKTTEYMDLKVMKRSNSPFIVEYYGCIFTENFVYICMEEMTMCLKKLCKNYLQPQNITIPEEILGIITVAVVEALKYLKDEHGIIHRDVKPENILLHKNGAIKLCDFGIAAKLNDEKAMKSGIGTLLYSAPERL
uniref:Protein kinase domain-containing protein n=1 Tax=Panagrolaimus sp. PS1159 TaxID=55785 RepID=A0AC35FVT0_9BILA